MTAVVTSPTRLVARLIRENDRLCAELAEVRKTSRKQVRDLQHTIALTRAAELAAAEAEICHLRDELTALRMEAGQE